MSANAPGENPADSNGQLLPERVAELAGELAETESESRRQRIARQIPELASRSGQATWRGLRASGDSAWRGVQSGTSAAARRIRPTRDAAAKGMQTGREVVTRQAQVGGDAAMKGLQASGSFTGRGLRASGRATRRGLQLSGRWLTAQAVDMAPKVPIRGIATLRSQYPGLDTEQLAERLILAASRASSGVGAAVGAAAAVPFVPTTPVEIGVETLALVAIELKLIAELHEVYGMPAPGPRPQRMLAYLGSWAERRGVRVTTGGLVLAVGSPLRRKLERRLLVKAGQSTLSLAPLLAGAAAGAYIDRRETRKLGDQIRADLRNRAAPA
jgi:hypothetical protein